LLHGDDGVVDLVVHFRFHAHCLPMPTAFAAVLA
jgi:hypothetical protein